MTTLADRIRHAAIEHASIPLDPTTGRHTNSPLYALIPDGQPVPPEVADVVEEITGRPLVPADELVHIYATDPRTIPARSRAQLNRWAIRVHWEEVQQSRDDIRARNLYRDLNPGKSGIVR